MQTYVQACIHACTHTQNKINLNFKNQQHLFIAVY